VDTVDHDIITDDEDEEYCEGCDSLVHECWCDEKCGICDSHINDCYCCSDCGQPESNCGCDYHGVSEITPWERRGYRSINTSAYSGRKWYAVWPEINIGSIDPVQSAADFYLLEALSANVVFPEVRVRPIGKPSNEIDEQFFELIGITDPVQRQAFIDMRNEQIANRLESDPMAKLAVLSEKADELLRNLVEKLDKSFAAYLDLAIGGEIRYHRALANRFLSPARDAAWVEWRAIREVVGNEALLDVADLFMEFDPGSSFGGEPWAKTAEVLYHRLEGNLGPNEYMNKKLFVDRVFTLEHNNGCVLNKVNWCVLNSRCWDLGGMRDVLDAHASDDYLTLFRVASNSVRELFAEYAAVAEPLISNIPKWFEFVMQANEIRVVCRYCWSNPRLGHHRKCSVIASPEDFPDFDGEVDLNIEKTWYSIVHGYEFDDYTWDGWYPDDSGHKYDVGPEGFKITENSEAEVKFHFSIETTGRGRYYGIKSYKMPLKDLIDNKLKISLKRFNSKAGPVGDVMFVNWNYTIFVDGVPKDSEYAGRYFKWDSSPELMFNTPVEIEAGCKLKDEFRAAVKKATNQADNQDPWAEAISTIESITASILNYHLLKEKI